MRQLRLWLWTIVGALSTSLLLSAQVKIIPGGSGSGGGGGTPGGSDTQVQFNDGGSFGGSANLTFDKATGVLARTGAGFLQLGPDTYGASGWSGYNVGIEIKRDASTEANTAELWIEAALGNIAGASAEGVVAYSRTAGAGATQNSGNLYALEGYTQNELPSGRSSGELYALTGVSSANGGGTTPSAWGLKARVSATNSSVINTAYGVDAQITDLSASAGTNTGYGFQAQFTNSTALSAAYEFYGKDLGGKATQPYYSWFDSRGVGRCREDNTFNSVGQVICGVYNPQVVKYTPGAANFERIIYGQWNSNVAEIGTEAGGTGTLRGVKIIGASLDTPATLTANGVAVATTKIAARSPLYPVFSPSGDDDEFDDASFSGWTAVNSGSHNPTITETNDVASFLLPGSDSASELHAYMKTRTINTNDYIEVAYRNAGLSQNYNTFALVFADGGTYGAGNQVAFANPSELNTFSYYTYTNYSSASNINTYGATHWFPGVRFMRFKYLGSNTWQGYVSADGISWAAVGPNQSRTLTPTRVGFAISTWGGTSQHVFTVLYVRFGNG